MSVKWHAISLKDAFLITKSNENGLSTSEANLRLKEFGRNFFPQEKPPSKIRLFLAQFQNPLMYILLAAVLISFFLKNYSDTIFIIVVLLINTTIGFYQENKASQTLLALKKMVKITAKVLRDGYEKEIDSEELVVGDVILLRTGDKVPADGRIIESKGLKINEASLTGEWWPVEKEAKDFLAESATLSERKNMVFMGTIVEEGWAKVLVVATGLNTQIGKIFSLIKETKKRQTPLQKKISHLSKLVGAFIFLSFSLLLSWAILWENLLLIFSLHLFPFLLQPFPKDCFLQLR